MSAEPHDWGLVPRPRYHLDTTDGHIPPHWLPAAKVSRVILHWTAGGAYPGLLDRWHYHLLVDQDGTMHRAHAPIGRWPAHTRGLNTGSVGLAACGMAGAQARGSNNGGVWPGRFPLSAHQVEALCVAAAQVLHHYGLAVTERTCPTHCEVPRIYGIPQRGKWDISWLPGMNETLPALVGERLRQRIRDHWRHLPPKDPYP